MLSSSALTNNISTLLPASEIYQPQWFPILFPLTLIQISSLNHSQNSSEHAVLLKKRNCQRNGLLLEKWSYCQVWQVYQEFSFGNMYKNIQGQVQIEHTRHAFIQTHSDELMGALYLCWEISWDSECSVLLLLLLHFYLVFFFHQATWKKTWDKR